MFSTSGNIDIRATDVSNVGGGLSLQGGTGTGNQQCAEIVSSSGKITIDASKNIDINAGTNGNFNYASISTSGTDEVKIG